MAESSEIRDMFDRDLKREQTRQKRQRQSGQNQQLNARLEQHDNQPTPMRKKKARGKSQEGTPDLPVLGPTEELPALAGFRPSPSPHFTPPDLSNTIEELLAQMSEVTPPQEDSAVEEEPLKPLGWNLPPPMPNWNDYPPKKKEVPNVVLFGKSPTYVYDEKEDENIPPPPPSLECPFHHLPCLPTCPMQDGYTSSVLNNLVRSS